VGVADGGTGFDPVELWNVWWRALGVRAPLSGDVTQDVETSLIRSIGDLGFININTSRAGDPDLERRITGQVASYGRQLGRMLDAVDVLIRTGRKGSLSVEDQQALDAVQSMRAEIEQVKQRSAAERVDRVVADVRRLGADREANREALQRIRDALG
jgi:hypothetical protein